jgi:glycosyltransferase involved in cell wall biosynthesis
MLNIGIDARLVDGKGGGTKIYATNLIKYLIRFDRENTYFLYSYAHHSLLDRIVKGFDNVKIRETNNKLIWRTPLIYFLMKKDKIDLIHFPAYNVAPRFFKHPKVIVTFHGIDAEYFRKRKRHLYWKINYRISAKMSDKVIAVSAKLKEEMCRLYKLPQEKIVTIYYGFPKEEISQEKLKDVKKKYEISDDDTFILCVDGAEKRKNIITFIKSIKILIEKYNLKRIKIIITRSSFYKELITSLNLNEYIKLYDWIRHEDLKYLYTISKLVVYPSIYEGVGFPVIEAIRYGKPVLISANTAMGEIVNEPELTIQEPFNPNAWAKSIYQLLNDEHLYLKLSKKMEERSKIFSIENMISQHLKLYQEVALHD